MIMDRNLWGYSIFHDISVCGGGFAGPNSLQLVGCTSPLTLLYIYLLLGESVQTFILELQQSILFNLRNFYSFLHFIVLFDSHSLISANFLLFPRLFLTKKACYLIQNIVDQIFPMVTFDGDQIIFAAVGGIILGIATSLNYIIRGKVTGMSGIVFGIVSGNKKQIPQKISIVGGMFMISGIFYLIFGQNNYQGFQPFGPDNQVAAYTTYPGFALSGLLVGFGTKLGNGCTSGHGLCGISRFSIRSIVAVCVFLFTAIGFSTLIAYQGLGPFYNDPSLSPEISYDHTISSICFIAIGLIFPAIGFLVGKYSGESKKETKQQIIDQLIVFIVGILFAIGLMVSGMSRRINILEFLQINQYWNPALLFVLGCGLAVNLVTFTIMRKKGFGLNGEKVFDPQNSKIDWKLIVGAFCFGLGWGLGGLCPGPFLVLFTDFTVPIQVIWGGCLIIGMYCAYGLSQYLEQKQKQQLETTETSRIQKQLNPSGDLSGKV